MKLDNRTDETRALVELTTLLAKVINRRAGAFDKAVALAAQLKLEAPSALVRAEAYQLHDLLRIAADAGFVIEVPNAQLDKPR